MKKFYFILLLLFPLLVQAQTSRLDTIRVAPDDSWRSELTPLPFNFDKTKIRFGANLGLSMSKNYTTFAIGPQIGYQFSDYLMIGTGVKYHHIRANTYSYEVRNNLLGANLFSYIYPIKPITLFIQPEINHIWRNVTYKDTNEKVTASGTVPVFLIGAGFHLGHSSHITINYDLVRHKHSPYPDTIFLGIAAFF
ncbi:MAG: hypothetical protein LBI15_10320 [Dysgonamonadaceae bacterium]|jgi:hypothetical protein|nr:hypothetical protein [Dysgonamonadaceae bacterium]